MDRPICYTDNIKTVLNINPLKDKRGERILANKDYTTIKLPNEIIKRIEEILKTNEYGFKSKSEFIKEAIRQELKHYEKNKQQ